MPSASASGSDAKRGGATSRDHNQGNQDRKYTDDQKAAVLRIRKCQPTAFYEILMVERSSTDNEIKKAYRKQSLLTHPDKNGYEGADEAFKMVSRAFQILSDEEKKSKYDKFGGDPDSRFQPGPSASSGASPFGGFGGGGFPRGGQRFDEEVSAEEMFNRFFNGGFGGMGGGGFGGPQFVFNMGGGPGFRVHQFGGQAPRRRPRAAAATEQEAQIDGRSFLRQLLPLILLFILPLLSSLFSGSSTPSGPSYRFDTPVSPHTLGRTTPKLNLNYFVNPLDVDNFSARNFRELDSRVEVEYVRTLRNECDAEAHERERRLQDAQGWLFPDVEKMKKARAMEMPSCRRLDQLKTKRF
ncbi:Heat shock protein DnaJ [Penicillium cf. griseofulvum]|uniref:Heat shock protein DnaJ n=1 Tax=Penicillium cf. griseofulvum TaxID=2972120 RepID=A0A9W9JFE9_9EURO|nr:Heat shock protein DnaJ [Penicillium cf. griseofulvum]KAJ5445229.1 Heat shock protein DnaJ [Penicillium cf. griseofulvum]KAJ5446953.1 Heat shock protein DnaJ [Penicillium cf. griseofulvum]